MRRFECALGRGTQGDGVHDVRILSMAVGLTALFILSTASPSLAASANVGSYGDHRAQASYRSAPVSRASQTPANCIREACGRLWCWHMRGESASQ